MQNEQDVMGWETDESLDIRHMWQVIDRRKWQILLFAGFISVLAGIVVMLVEPVYRGTATVLIESNQANVVSIEAVYGLDNATQQYYDTQFSILRSRPIAEAVVSDLNLLNRSEIPSVDPDAGWFGRKVSNTRRWLHQLSPSSEDEQNSGPRRFDETVRSYMERLKISPIVGTQLVQIHFDSTDRSLTADVANAHANAYIESVLDARLVATQSASSWMGRRVEDLQQKLSDSEARLQNYLDQENIIGSTDVQGLQTQEINDLTGRLVAARRMLSDTRIAYEQVRSGSAPGDEDRLANIPLVSRDEAVQKFREAEAEAEQQVAELTKRYGPKHPSMLAAQSELEKASQNVRRQQQTVASGTQADFLAAQSDVAQLERELASAKTGFQDVGRKLSRLAALQREVDVNTQLHDMFYNRMQETEQTGDLESVNARITSPAILPLKAFSPNRRLFVTLVFIASVIFGVVAAFLNENLNDTFRSADYLEDKLGVPILGIVPLVKADRAGELLSAHAYVDPDVGEFSEGIRTVRTGLALDGLDSPHKIILITSSVSGEGKSTISMSLASAFAQMEKTLLIDGDLRRPSVAKGLGFDPSQPGLTELLAGIAERNVCIVHRDTEKFDTLSAGFIPPDPQILLSSQRFANLLASLQKTYDRIIIDCPPVLPVSDTVLMSRFADTVVMVVQAESTTSQKARLSLRKLKRADAPVVGAVLNQLDADKAAKYSDYGYGGYYESYVAEGVTADVDFDDLKPFRGESDDDDDDEPSSGELTGIAATIVKSGKVRRNVRVRRKPAPAADEPAVSRLLQRWKQDATAEGE
jgi:succinoglycan biosynthesis transport protein ExoP